MSDNLIQSKQSNQKTIINHTKRQIKNKKRRTRKKIIQPRITPVPMRETEPDEDMSKPITLSSNISETEPQPEPIQTTLPTPKKKNPPKVPLEKSELVKMFLEMLTTIKLYHWNTHSYSRHKATDELHEKLSELVDEFVEVMQGKMFSPNRIRTINEEIKAITPTTKDKMVDKILYYIEQLQNLDHLFSSKKDSDLLNIRDEMVAHLNQFLYLFSFDEI